MQLLLSEKKTCFHILKGGGFSTTMTKERIESLGKKIVFSGVSEAIREGQLNDPYRFSDNFKYAETGSYPKLF